MMRGDEVVAAFCIEIGLALIGAVAVFFLAGWGVCALVRWLA